MLISCTVALAQSSSPPIGAKMMPTAKKSGKTVLGVRIGCHAFSRCCRKAVSVPYHQRPVSMLFRRLSTYWGVFCSSASSLAPRSPACYRRPLVPWFATCLRIRPAQSVEVSINTSVSTQSCRQRRSAYAHPRWTLGGSWRAGSSAEVGIPSRRATYIKHNRSNDVGQIRYKAYASLCKPICSIAQCTHG